MAAKLTIPVLPTATSPARALTLDRDAGTLLVTAKAREPLVIPLIGKTSVRSEWEGGEEAPVFVLTLNRAGEAHRWELPMNVIIMQRGRLVKFLSGLAANGVHVENERDWFEDEVASAPEDLEWKRLDGWLIQVILFGIFCAWPFPFLMISTLLTGEMMQNSLWLTGTGAIFAGWMILVVFVSSKYAINPKGIGLHSIAHVKWIPAEKILGIQQIEGEDKSGILVYLKGGRSLGFDTAFKGVHVQKELLETAEKWKLTFNQKPGTFSSIARMINDGKARGKGLERWRSEGKALAAVNGISLIVLFFVIVVPLWFMQLPDESSIRNLLTFILVMIGVIVMVIINTIFAWGERMRIGWSSRIFVIKTTEKEKRVEGLKSALRMDKIKGETGDGLPQELEGGMRIRLWTNMRWAVPPTGLTVLKVSLAGPDKTSLETIAQKVEQQLLGSPYPWQAPRTNGAPNLNNPPPQSQFRR